MIDIKELSESDLKQKIENIKAEREKIANALKRYEEELERKKQKVPLGVPTVGKYCVLADGQVNYRRNQGNMERKILEEVFNTFPSYESGKKNAEMLLAWRKALVSNSKDEAIDIQVLLPLLPKGWVWMQDDRRWYWSKEKPEIFSNAWRIWHDGYYTSIFAFNLKPSDDWKTSLMECGL